MRTNLLMHLVLRAKQNVGMKPLSERDENHPRGTGMTTIMGISRNEATL